MTDIREVEENQPDPLRNIGLRPSQETGGPPPREKVYTSRIDSPFEQERQETRQFLWARIGYQFGMQHPGANWSSAIPVLVDKFMEMANPELLAAVEDDVNVLWALTDTDLAMRIERGEPLGELDPLFDAMTEILWEVGAQEEAVEWLSERQDSVRGSFDALTATDISTIGPGVIGLKEGEEEKIITEGASFVLSAFDQPGAWSYDPDINLVAITVGEETIGFQPRAGFEPTSTLDVIAEAVVAMANSQTIGAFEDKGLVANVLEDVNEMGRMVESTPVVVDTVNSLWSFFTSLAHPVARDILPPDPFEPFNQAIDTEKKQINTEAYLRASQLRFPEEALIAQFGIDLTRLAAEEGITPSALFDPLALAAELVETERDQLKDTFTSLNQEEFIKVITEELDEKTALGGALETGLEGVLGFVMVWEGMVQRIGLGAIRAVIEGPASLGAIGLPEEGEDTPFGLFRKAYDAEPSSEAKNIAEYFDLEGGWADAALLIVGIGFDPINLFLPGGKGQRALFVKAMTQPAKYGRHYLSLPAVRSVTSKIAGGRDDALRRILYLEFGSDSNQYVLQLFDLAHNPAATQKMVDDVLLDAMTNGSFLGAGPNRLLRMSTGQGIGRMADNLGTLTDEQVEMVFDLTQQAGRMRHLPLGENQGLDEFIDIVLQLEPTNMELGEAWARKAMTALETPTGSAQIGVLAAEKQVARDTLNTLGKSRAVLLSKANPVAMRINRDALADSVRFVDDLPLDDAAKTQLRDRMTSRLTRLDVDLTATDDALAALHTEMASANKVLVKTTRLEADLLDAANRPRAELARVLYEFYDDVAVRINTEAGQDLIPLTDDFYDLAPKVPRRDWSAVTGGPSGVARGRLKVTEGFAIDTMGEVDKVAARRLSAMGAFSKLQQAPLPASPYEIILFRRIGGNPNLLAKWTNHARKSALSTWSRRVRLLFGFNLLMNGITPIKTTADETFRFFAVTGALGRTLKATAAGTPGAQAVMRKLGTLPGFRRFMTGAGEFVTSPWALQHQRSHQGFAGAAGWGWIKPPKGARQQTSGITREAYRNHAERWVNGTLVQDDLFQAYARATGVDASALKVGEVPQAFVDWWDDVGSLNRKTSEFIVGKGITETVDAGFAYRGVHESFNLWINNNMKGTQQWAMRRRILQAAKTDGALDIRTDAHLLNSILQVPAAKPMETGFLGRGLEFAFGRPSARRSGVFFETFFDEAADILAQRFGGAFENGTIVARGGGRLLDAQFIVDHTDDVIDLARAQEMIAQGTSNPVVRQMLDTYGLRTTTSLEARAAAYAGRRADELMYRYTAGSLVGKGIESALMFPFARAQMDFLAWWSKHLTTPQQIAPNIPFTKYALSIPQVPQLPINLRAWSKYAHLTAATQNEYEDTVVDNSLGKLTFFPLRYDDEFMMDIAPQPGPFPGWMFDLGVSGGWWGEEYEKEILAIFPTLAFDEATGDPAKDFFDALLPLSRRSVRGLLVSAARSLTALTGNDLDETEGLLGSLYSYMSDNQVPRFLNDMVTADYADWLGDNAFTTTPGSDEWLEATDVITLESALKVNTSDGVGAVKTRLTPFSDADREAQFLGSYEGLLTGNIWAELLEYDVLAENELLDVDGLPRIQTVYNRWKDGEASRDDMAFLSDALYRIYTASDEVELVPGFTLMDFINISHPEVAPNLVSKSECSPGNVPRDFKAEHCDPQTNRLQNISPGRTGTDLIRDARRKGWITYRSPDGVDGWMMDAHRRIYQSAKRAVAAVWYLGTRGYGKDGEGREWSGRSTQAFDRTTVTTGPTMAALLSPLGFNLEATTMTGEEFFNLLHDMRDQFNMPFTDFIFMQGSIGKGLARADGPYGRELRQAIEEAGRQQSANGIDSIRDWPEELKEAIRNDVTQAINLNHFSLNDYKSEWQDLFGSIDYESPIPPSVEELGKVKGTAGVTFGPEQVESGEVGVIDGDTLSVLLSDGLMRIRLFGINAPEIGQNGYQEATANLINLLEEAESVTIGFFQTETLGLVQRTSPEENRLIGWLYVNGIPIYDPSVFTADNPRGAGVGGEVLDLAAILAGR